MATEEAKNYARLVARAWADPEFKKRLMENPAHALAEEGLSATPGVHIHVCENTAHDVYLVIPGEAPPPDAASGTCAASPSNPQGTVWPAFCFFPMFCFSPTFCFFPTFTFYPAFTFFPAFTFMPTFCWLPMAPGSPPPNVQTVWPGAAAAGNYTGPQAAGGQYETIFSMPFPFKPPGK